MSGTNASSGAPTSQPSGIPTENQYKITILLKEYDTLRQEILARIASRFTLVTVFAGLVTLNLRLDITYGWIALAVWAVVITIHWWVVGWLIVDAANRVADIERRVNDLAGERLLTWESDHAKARRGSRVPQLPRKYETLPELSATSKSDAVRLRDEVRVNPDDESGR